MSTPHQSKFSTRLLGGLSVVAVSTFFLWPHTANASSGVIVGTGVNCITNSGIPGVDPSACVDQIYTDGFSLDPLYKTNLNSNYTNPSFLAVPAGASGAFWDTMKGDIQFGSPVNVWTATFTTPPGTGNITVNGTIAANGPVAVALNGFGNFGGLESTTQLGNFSVTMASGTTNTLDFIFTGCSSGFPCGNSAVYALLVDPSWSQAGAGATLDTIPESLLIADGGVNPVPLPASVWLMLSALVGVGVMARKRRDIAA